MFNGLPDPICLRACPRFFENLEWIVAEWRTLNHYPVVVLEKEFQSNKPAAYIMKTPVFSTKPYDANPCGSKCQCRPRI